MDDPTIILIGGAAGTAKTSCGKILSNELDINHRLGSGFIREIAKSFIPMEENPYLYNYSFKPHNDVKPFENLFIQSKPINDSMERCIHRAYSEGTSLLIEGVNVIPGLISTNSVSAAIILTVQDYDTHYAMVKGDTHAKRGISESDFKNIREIQDQFIELAKGHNWHNIDISQTVDIAKIVKQIIKGQ